MKLISMKFKKPHNFLLIFLLVFFTFSVKAQELLTAEDAVAIALENNYQIKIVAKELKIDQTSVTPGLAGMLPQVNAVVDNNRSQQDITQVRSDGTQISRDNAKNNNLSYGVELGWTIFDGLRMFARYDQLKEIKNLGEAELQQAVLGTLSNVMTTYYNLVQQQQQLTALDTTLVISRQRVELANNRFEIGKASKLELLNAQVDENTDLTLRLRQQELYENTKINLNEIIARDVKTKFKVVDSIEVDADLFLPKLEELAQEQNPQLQAQQINRRIAELEFKQVRAARYPIIIAQTGYNFSDSENSLGFTTSNNVQGFNYGFSATLNIFDGFNQNRNEKIAKIQIENTTLVIEQQTQTLLSQLSTAYQTYSTNLLLVDLETKNQEIAKENLDITLAKYKIGTIPTIEFRTAQLNYINAVLRSSNAAYEAKLSEITLKQLAGNLDL